MKSRSYSFKWRRVPSRDAILPRSAWRIRSSSLNPILSSHAGSWNHQAIVAPSPRLRCATPSCRRGRNLRVGEADNRPDCASVPRHDYRWIPCDIRSKGGLDAPLTNATPTVDAKSELSRTSGLEPLGGFQLLARVLVRFRVCRGPHRVCPRALGSGTRPRPLRGSSRSGSARRPACASGRPKPSDNRSA